MTIQELYQWAKEYGCEQLPVYIRHYDDYLEIDRQYKLTNHSKLSPNNKTVVIVEV